MVVIAVVLAALLVAAAVVAGMNRSRLSAQRTLTSAAEERSAAREADLATKVAELEQLTKEREAADELATERAEQARVAEERAAANEVAALASAEVARAAGERAAAAEAAATAYREAAASTAGGVDPDVLWILEQARSERTWRFSVAPGPDSPSVFAGTADPLLAALQVELDAAREEVGTVVELDAEIPSAITLAACGLALRAAQELIADIVRRSEETTLRVRADGDGLLVDVISIDEDGQPVLPIPLPIPPSPAVDLTLTGVRIHPAFVEADASGTPHGDQVVGGDDGREQ